MDIDLVFGMLAVVFIVELVLALTWNRAYFSWGLPLFTCRVEATTSGLVRFPFPRLESEVEPTRWSRLVFRQVSARTCGFRESTMIHVGPGYLPVMRGLIVIDRQRREVRIIGLCNWSVLLMLVMTIIALPANPAAMLILMAFFAYSYAMQWRRFRNVADAVGVVLAENDEFQTYVRRQGLPQRPY